EGERRGFYIISYDNDIETINADFIEIKIADIIFNTINVNQNTVKQIEDKISSVIEQMEDLTDKIVLIKVKGTLLSGKRSDINFSRFEEKLTANKLLLALKKEKIENETVNDFEKRLMHDVKFVMGISDINK